MRTPFRIFIVLILATGSVNAQQVLEDYIQEGLKNNLVLQQKSVGLEKAMLSLKAASGMFLPSVALQGNYTSGDGGRSISLPIGDMLNPVYSTLNQLTDSDQFPQVENVNQNFFPNNFYDVKVRTTVPIINSDLVYNKKIRQQQVLLQEFEQEIYKRELVRDIKVAYFNYLSALEAVNIYQSALTRATENKRVNESLLNNGRGLPAYVLRSESEIENIKSQITDAQKQVHNAQLYFNFLLNRDSEATILEGFNAEEELRRSSALMNGELSIQQREELQQLREATSLNQNVLKMNKLFWSPRLSGFLDLGSQYENWKFNQESRYYLFGFQLDVPLFAGFTNRNKIKQSKLDVKITELNYSVVSRQLQMSNQMARNSLQSAYESYESSQKQFEAAQSYMRLIEKGYKEGVNTFIEAIDARNQLTAAQLQQTINQYRVLIATANFEREAATYQLHK